MKDLTFLTVKYSTLHPCCKCMKRIMELTGTEHLQTPTALNAIATYVCMCDVTVNKHITVKC